MKYLIIVMAGLLALASGLSGCGNNGNSVAILTSAAYAPVTVGSTWSYARSDSGTQTQTITANTQDRVTKEVIDSAAGRSVASITISNIAQYLSAMDLYDASGVLTATKSYTPEPGQLFLPSATLPGTRVTQTVQVTTQPANITVTQSVDITVAGFETIAVPAGTFNNALKIVTVITPGPTFASWFAPNVGLIRQDVNGVNALQLTSYSIK